MQATEDFKAEYDKVINALRFDGQTHPNYVKTKTLKSHRFQGFWRIFGCFLLANSSDQRLQNFRNLIVTMLNDGIFFVLCPKNSVFQRFSYVFDLEFTFAEGLRKTGFATCEFLVYSCPGRHRATSEKQINMLLFDSPQNQIHIRRIA